MKVGKLNSPRRDYDVVSSVGVKTAWSPQDCVKIVATVFFCRFRNVSWVAIAIAGFSFVFEVGNVDSNDRV